MVGMVSSGCGQDLDCLQQIAVLGMNLCSFENPAQVHQQFETHFVQIAVLQELQCGLFGREQFQRRPVSLDLRKCYPESTGLECSLDVLVLSRRTSEVFRNKQTAKAYLEIVRLSSRCQIFQEATVNGAPV